MRIEWLDNGKTRGEQHRRCRCLLQQGAVATILVLLMMGGVSAWADPAQGGSTRAPEGPGRVFSEIEAAWAAEDSEALADLVQVDGIRVSLGGAAERIAEYSPSQSVYFFKNLFRTRETSEFTFTRLQEVVAGDRAHAMAVWRFAEPGNSTAQELRLVFLLTRQDDMWRLSEINKITVR